MATSYLLPDDDFKQIAPQIAQYMGGVLNLDLASPVQMGETFETWSAVRIVPGEPLTTLATFDERYHHQIFARVTRRDVPIIGATGLEQGELAPVGAAWSVRHADGTWSVRKVAETWLAAAIDRAIRDVDEAEGVPEKAVARLLRVPAFAVHAFWLVSDNYDRVYVIARPSRFEQVPVGELMPSSTFVQILSRQRPIQGVTPD